MFETNIPSMRPAATPEGAELRAFDWAELTARLAAARDLRQVAARRRDHAGASFDQLVAGGIAAQDNDKRAVNPNALARGKGRCGNTPEVVEEAINGDRENR